MEYFMTAPQDFLLIGDDYEEDVMRWCQPDYRDSDEVHSITTAYLDDARDFLQNPAHIDIISLNSCVCSNAAAINALANCTFHHFPVTDFTSLSGEQAISIHGIIAAAVATANHNALIYCGYGHGRTGTALYAYTILSGRQAYNRSTAEDDYHVENDAQHGFLASLRP
jgi:protein tyrosine phosphatase